MIELATIKGRNRIIHWATCLLFLVSKLTPPARAIARSMATQALSQPSRYRKRLSVGSMTMQPMYRTVWLMDAFGLNENKKPEFDWKHKDRQERCYRRCKQIHSTANSVCFSILKGQQGKSTIDWTRDKYDRCESSTNFHWYRIISKCSILAYFISCDVVKGQANAFRVELTPISKETVSIALN
jgi:hypothetical protein